MGDATPPRGQGGGSSEQFSERLWPSPTTWLLVPLAGGFGAATGYVGGAAWAAAAGAALAAVAAWVVLSASTVVALGADGVLRVGRARIEVRHLTGAASARGADARALTGPLLDARTHLCLRGWVDPVVIVGLGDPEDPTPSWVFSTRRPEELVEVLRHHGVSGRVAVHTAPSAAPGATWDHDEETSWEASRALPHQPSRPGLGAADGTGSTSPRPEESGRGDEGR